MKKSFTAYMKNDNTQSDDNTKMSDVNHKLYHDDINPVKDAISTDNQLAHLK